MSDLHTHQQTWKFLRRILHLERRDIGIVVAYSTFTSILSLVVPLASQAIVNAVALGVFNLQLVALCIMVFAALAAAGVIDLFERFVIEMIRRRLFVRTAFDIVQRLPHVHASKLEGYAPELVNRFFDVITMQKSISKFLFEGVNAILILFTGMVLLGVYHPFFLVYDLILIAFIPVLVFVLGRGGIETAVIASKKKYATAAWLEEVARVFLALKFHGTSAYPSHQLDVLLQQWVTARRTHFRVYLRQVFSSSIFRAIATVGVLALGGLLVIDRQISLGQLVAAEIVLILILGAVDKLINQLDAWYDLVAASDKVSSVLELPIEQNGKVKVVHRENGGTIAFKDIHHGYPGQPPLLSGVSLTIQQGQRVSLVGRSGAGKSTLLRLLLGTERADRGVISYNDVDVRIADLNCLRREIGIAQPENLLINASILDNILLGREIDHADVMWALDMAYLRDDVETLPEGLSTMISSMGLELPYGLRRRIQIARAIVQRPDTLLLDECFDGVDDAMKLHILDGLFAYSGWTIINVSHDLEIIRRTHMIHVLHGGVICESGTPADLTARQDSTFKSLFPES